MKQFSSIIFAFLFPFLISSTGIAQSNKQEYSAAKQPKLVVGIVVDQMRYDYIPLYWDKFEDGGFKRLVTKGYSYNNNHFNYVPTYTGPGHAAVYTGTTPAKNGIVGNSWYDRSAGKSMYVTSDSETQPVGTDAGMGKMSPKNLLSTTVTDELKNESPKSKVIGISIKDRGAILPAGHQADGVYWYEDDTGRFVSSSWYVDKLPEWIKEFNKEGLAKKYSNKSWKPLLAMDQYTESNADDTPYEGAFDGEEKPVFPHNMDSSTDRIQSSPFGNTLTKELAKSAIDGESMGADNHTDFLAVSFSSTDYVGHQFGPHSVEVEDTYLRLDRDLNDLLSYLDQKVGEGSYVVMLTADHGAVEVPSELMDKGLPGGYFDSDHVVKKLDDYLTKTYGQKEWIEDYKNQQIYLNRDLISEQEHSLKEMQKDAAHYLLQFEGVKSTNTAYNFQYENYSHNQQAMYQRGFLYARSGDVYIQLKSGWLDSSYKTGTSHGSPYNYDTHVPLLFYGWNVPQGSSSKHTAIPQIAPTISNMLNIPMPSASRARVLQFD